MTTKETTIEEMRSSAKKAASAFSVYRKMLWVAVIVLLLMDLILGNLFGMANAILLDAFSGKELPVHAFPFLYLLNGKMSPGAMVMFDILYICVIACIWIYIATKIEKVFINIHDGDSPFEMSSYDNLKKAFIGITVVFALNSLIAGVILGLTLAAVLKIFRYGCELQKDSDETI